MSFIINILSTPAILVGLISLFGLILQKKPVEDVVKGTVKTIVGFLVLTAGSSFLQTGSLNDFGVIFNYAFNMQGVVPNNEAIVSLGLADFASDTAYIMCIGMIANIVLARFSRLHYIFLTGHHTLYMSAMLAIILNVGNLTGPMLWISGGLILGLIMVISPALCQPTMEKITGTDELGFGHFGGFGYWFSAQIGKLFKDKSKSTEDVNFPQRISFLRDTTVAIGLTMTIFFVVVTFVAVVVRDGMSDPTISAFFKGETQTHWIVWAITKGLSFAGGVYIILSGVRLIIGEIVPAFRGIAEKIVPNAKPAIDCPVVFPYAPNAEGGLKGCLVGSFLHGLLITFLPAICMPVMGSLNFANCTFSDADFSITGIILGNIAQFVKGGGLFAVCVVLFLLPIIYNVIMPKKKEA